MIDLLAHSVRLMDVGGREVYAFPSISFVRKCEETIRDHPERGPYPPL